MRHRKGETVQQRRSLAGSLPIAGASPVLESVLNNRRPKRKPIQRYTKSLATIIMQKSLIFLINTKLVGPESHAHFMVMKDAG